MDDELGDDGLQQCLYDADGINILEAGMFFLCLLRVPRRVYGTTSGGMRPGRREHASSRNLPGDGLLRPVSEGLPRLP